MKKKIILRRVFHREKWRIMISFKIDESLVSLVRQIPGNAYSATYKSWYAEDTGETLKQILQVFRDKADIDISAITHVVGKCAEKGRSEDETAIINTKTGIVNAETGITNA